MQPFGNPDSALHSSELLPWTEPTEGDDLLPSHSESGAPIYVVTGASGAGKSRVLRSLRPTLEVDNVAAPAATAVARTDTWRSLARRDVDIAHWEQVWRCAIFASLATHVHVHREALERSLRKRLKKANANLPLDVLESGVTRHPLTLVGAFAWRLRGAPDDTTRDFFLGERWPVLEHAVRDGLPSCPPIMIEVDHLDDYYDNDPSVVSEAQAGLAMFLAHLEREPLPPNTAWIRVALRDSACRFLRAHTRDDASQLPHFTEVRWTISSLERLIEAGLERLELPTRDHPGFAAFSSSPTIYVPERAVTEPVHQYVLRHSTLNPREVIAIGNQLADRVGYLGRTLDTDELRHEVRELAATFARLKVTEMTSELMALGYRDTPQASNSRAQDRFLETAFRRFAEGIGSESFSRSELLQNVEHWDTATNPYLVPALWSARLIAIGGPGGVRQISRSVFDTLDSACQDLSFSSLLLDLYPLVPSEEVTHLEFI